MNKNDEELQELFDRTISSLLKSILTIDDLSCASLGEFTLEKIKYEHRKAIYRCLDRMKAQLIEGSDDIY